MKVGDLVRAKIEKRWFYQEQIGIIQQIGRNDLLISWPDGQATWCFRDNMEVI